MTSVANSTTRDKDGSPLEVLNVFLRLGLTCFGGPIAHIGYFREEFVVRRRWLDEPAYADLVGLCQFLPGPASSQVGFFIGLMRAGYRGGLAAWAGFTLPSPRRGVLCSRPSLDSRIVKGCPRLVTSVIAPLRAAASAAKALLRGALTTHVRPGFMWIDKRAAVSVIRANED